MKRKDLAGILASMLVLSACAFFSNITKGIEEC